MRIFHRITGTIFSAAIITAVFFICFQAALYADMGVYEKEYRKYDVLSELDMTMDDAMFVTERMMDYLIDDRHTLSAVVTIAGNEQEFFNWQDRFHMAEVKELFMGGLAIRSWSFAVVAVCLILLILTKADIRRILPRSYIAVSAVVIAALAAAGVAAAVDFGAVFTAFHHIFFDNDLWIFDPAEDYMIRMLPEGLFFDMALRVALMSGAVFLAMLAVSIAMCVKNRERQL